MKTAKIFVALIFIAAFALQISAQKNNLYPNELKNYQFSKDKRLQNLKPGISGKADITKNFGIECEEECDFDKNWTVKFKYFDSESESPDNFSETDLKPDPKYTGKLFSITLEPKSEIAFKNVELPKQFGFIGGIGATAVSKDKKTDSVTRWYRDSYGLKYEIAYRTELTNDNKEIAGGKTVNLKAIEYGISDVLIKRIFIKTK